MSATVDRRPAGSIAGPEFTAARRRLAERPVDDPRRPLPLAFAVPTATRPETDGDRPEHPPERETRRGDGRVVQLHRRSPGPLSVARDDLAAGRRRAAELVDEAIDAAERLDGDLHAIVELRADAARLEARRLDDAFAGGGPVGPLHGIPVTVKDVIDVAGFTTRAGSDAYEDVPAGDATAVARLRAAGAVVVAKTATHEFALGVTNPQSRNPHDTSRIPGGSSGGSAIAVALGMGLGSLGTDTRASIRVPASLSGVVGLKPTLGRVPTAGVVSLSWTMDHVAPMATTVADAALLLDVLLSPDPVSAATPLHDAAVRAAARGVLPPRAGGSRPWLVGVPAAGFTGAQEDVAAAVHAALALLDDAGAERIELDRPGDDDFADANALGTLVSRAEAASFHRRLGTDLTRCWPEIADQLTAAAEISAMDYLDAQRRRAQLADDLLGAFEAVDVLALPTTLVTAPPVDDFARYLMVLARNAIPFSFVGFPAISLPCGRDRHGLPIGLQLVAPPGREARLVAAAAAVEAAL